MLRAVSALALLLTFGAVAGGEHPAATAREPKGAITYSLTPERHERAVAFARAKVIRYFVGFLVGIAILAVLLLSGFAPWLRDLVARATPVAWLRFLLFVPAVYAVIAILELPVAVWGHRLAVAYEQSVQSFPSWLLDWAKREIVGIVLATLTTAVFFAIVRWSPERWWLWFWVALQPLVVFVIFIQPLVIAPLFFRFRPLAEVAPVLVERIGQVLARADLEIPHERMFEMNASSKLRSLNAYVAGIGGSKRVVVWDTTLERLDEDETLFVFGHELGHYVLGHIPRTLAIVAAVLLPVFYLLAGLVGALVTRFGPALGIRGVDDVAVLPLLLLVAAIAGEIATPIGNAYSRWQEHEADVYGLEIVRGIVAEPQHTAPAAFQKLGEVGLADPDPPAFVRFWLYSHPPIAERVRFAAGWR